MNVLLWRDKNRYHTDPRIHTWPYSKTLFMTPRALVFYRLRQVTVILAKTFLFGVILSVLIFPDTWMVLLANLLILMGFDVSY